jgi:pantoate--beta-alanine ligase
VSASHLVRCDDRVALDATLTSARELGQDIAFVPTMGALHGGHLALVRHAATLAPTVVVSIFVNPTQFDAAEDLAAYPRTLEADLDALDALVATGEVPGLVVYVPSVEDLYPDGPARTLHVPDVTEHLCGASRPGHFDGVATVVDVLLRAVRPSVLVLGRKDHQQLVVVRRMIVQQGHDVRVEPAPTVRDADGVAASSRNLLLDAPAREVAGRIPRALADAVALARAARASGSPLDPDALRTAVHRGLAPEEGRCRVDYAEVVDPELVVPVHGPTPAATQLLVAVAVHVVSGERSVRLIDNVLLGDVADEQRLLDAVGR